MTSKEALQGCRRAKQGIGYLQKLISATKQEPDSWERDESIKELEKRLHAERRGYLKFFAVCLEAVQLLSECERQALWCFYVLGMSNEAVARRMNYDVQSVYRAKRLGLEKLEKGGKAI